MHLGHANFKVYVLRFDLKETAVEICAASCSLVLAYHETRKRNGKMYDE